MKTIPTIQPGRKYRRRGRPIFPYFWGRIARNISFDKYDYNHAAKRSAEFEAELSELESCFGAENGVEREMEQREIAQYISDFLRKTLYSKRVVFIRRYWYCDSISAIAKEFGFSESKVKSMLMRTREELKKYLERQGVQV